MATETYLDAVQRRIVVFDGAFGTWMQAQDLGPADFGGEALEGCNENLVLTRPDLVAQMHDEAFGVGVDAVETATFGAFPLVLAEYDLADTTFELGRVHGDYLHGHERAARDGVPTGRLRDTDARSARSAWAAGAG